MSIVVSFLSFSCGPRTVICLIGSLFFISMDLSDVFANSFLHEENKERHRQETDGTEEVQETCHREGVSQGTVELQVDDPEQLDADVTDAGSLERSIYCIQ